MYKKLNDKMYEGEEVDPLEERSQLTAAIAQLKARLDQLNSEISK